MKKRGLFIIHVTLKSHIHQSEEGYNVNMTLVLPSTKHRGPSNKEQMKDIVKHYSNGEVTIVWKPSLCIHSGNCWRGLHEVFHPEQRPWITPEASTTEKIIAQVKNCPSGALSILDIEAKEE